MSHRGNFEFADLVPDLALQPDFVKKFVEKNINHLLYQEYARSFKNVVGQWAAFRDIMADLVAVTQSPEAKAFRQLVREIHPARMASLQDLADSIVQETSELKELITNKDFKRLESRLKRLGAKAADGAQKYKELQPKLLKLWLRYEEEAAKCEHAGQVSQDLLTQTEQHRDRWFWFLDFLGKSAAIGSASLFLGSATSIGYLYHLYQAKAAAMGLAKAKYAAAQKALAEKSVTVHAAAAEAKAAQAVAAHDHAAVISANHALQAGSGTGVATTVSSVHAGPKAVVGVAGCSAALGVYLVHSVDMAQAAYQAASTVADAASAAAGAAHSAMSGAAAEAASALSNLSSQQVGRSWLICMFIYFLWKLQAHAGHK